MEKHTFITDQNPPPYTPSQTYPHHQIHSYQDGFSFMNRDSSFETEPPSQRSYPPINQQYQPNAYRPNDVHPPRPCVIPQITTVFGGPHMSPFARPRVPALESQTGLSERELLNFIDGLNEAFMANPALQVTSRAGMVVGFVPLATTQIIGNCVEAAAGLGSAGVSVVRTKQYLKRVNQITFGPRGLCARVVKTEKMLSLVRVGGSFNSDQYSALVGRGSLERDYLDGQPSSGRDVSGQSVARVGSPIERRMELLGECVMRLSFDGVASPAEADNWMKRWGAYSAQQAEQKQLKKLKEKDEKKSRKSEKESRKTERKERKADNEIADIMDDIDDVQCQIQGLDLSRRKDEKTERELRKDLKKLERKLAELKDEREYEISRKSSRSDKKEMTRDEKEAKKIDKLYWIIILPVDRSTSGEHDLESEAEEQVVTEQAMRS